MQRLLWITQFQLLPLQDRAPSEKPNLLLLVSWSGEKEKKRVKGNMLLLPQLLWVQAYLFKNFL